MKKVLCLLTFMIVTAAQAKVISFKCATEKPYEKNQTRSIEFSLDFKSESRILIVNLGPKAFRITPRSDTLRALNTADNSNVEMKTDRLILSADEIGMYHTNMVFWKNTSFRTGFVTTSGESNTKTYSPITCEVK